MAKIYGTPIMAGGAGGANKDLPPLLGNFKAKSTGTVPLPLDDEGTVEFSTLPSGTKVRMTPNNPYYAVVTHSRTDNNDVAIVYDTKEMGLPKMRNEDEEFVVASESDIFQWMNATSDSDWWSEVGGNRIEPSYSNEPGFLNVIGLSLDSVVEKNFELQRIPPKYDTYDVFASCFTAYMDYDFFDEKMNCEETGRDYLAVANADGGCSTYNGRGSSEVSVYAPTPGTGYISNTLETYAHIVLKPKLTTKVKQNGEEYYFFEESKILELSAEKMATSRANELAGAVWVYADHEPTSVNDGTKIQLSREEIITDRKPKPETITLADIPVSDESVATIVNLKESDGALHPYLYLSQNYQGSNGALLLRKDLLSELQYWYAAVVQNYNGCYIDTYCTNTFFNTILDPVVSSQIMTANIPSGSTTLQRKAFLLSAYEYGWTSASPQEGTPIPYFSSNERRISHYNGAGRDYWTRTYKSGTNPWFIGPSGNAATDNGTLRLGARPAFVLPMAFKLNPIQNSDGSYDMYEDSSAASTFASSEFTVEKQVSWENTKDFYARQFTYNSKKQYQTMLEGAIATLNDVPEGQPITELESGSKVKLGVWNDTPLQWKVARDTSDQSIRLVLEPTSVSLLGDMAYDAAEPSNSDKNRKSYGNNRYIYSNIHQWLNATKASGWYTAQHSADAAPAYASSPGFLSGWSENHIAALDSATLTTSRESVDGGGTETFVARVALISTTELGLQSNTGGGRLDIFSSDGDRATGSYYWTRTPYPSSSIFAYPVTNAGGLGNGGYVNGVLGVRPLCIPASTALVSLEMDDDNCYTITGVNE